MDSRKLSSSDMLELGILDLPMPESQCPKDAVLHAVDESNLTTGGLRQGLEDGGLQASMSYGSWFIWKTDAGFSGELLQYRSVTDAFSAKQFEEALGKAEEWAYGCRG